MTSNQEILRLRQLQLMGITSYFPRFALPGALPSELRSWEVEGTSEDVPEAAFEDSSEIAQRPAERAPVFAPVNERRRDFDVHSPKPSVATPVVTQQSQTGKEPAPQDVAEDTLSLHLLLIPVDASLCVLNQLPVLAKSQMQQKQQKLLDNILFFLGKRAAAYHSLRTFRWPLPGMLEVTSANAAKSSLMHFLEQFFQESSFSNLLVMGEQGADWLREAGKLQTDTIPSPPQWHVLHTYSLDQMLTLPSIKREVWQHLLPLQARLQTD